MQFLLNVRFRPIANIPFTAFLPRAQRCPLLGHPPAEPPQINDKLKMSDGE
jgi:hypothetical protein